MKSLCEIFQILITRHITLTTHENANHTKEKMIFGNGGFFSSLPYSIHRAISNPLKSYQKYFNAGMSNAAREND